MYCLFFSNIFFQSSIFYFILILAVIYGVLFMLPIGGADMPVVISILNSFTGVAAACGGFLYDNKAMLTGGILVDAAGTLLTILMCRAMNPFIKKCVDRIVWCSKNRSGQWQNEERIRK